LPTRSEPLAALCPSHLPDEGMAYFVKDESMPRLDALAF
jgi:hypothetical protein